MFFLGFLGCLPKDTSVALHQFPDQQKRIDSRDAVGYQTGDVLTLRASFPFDESLVPQSAELRVVLLYLRGEFLFTESDLFECVVLTRRLFYGKHG